MRFGGYELDPFQEQAIRLIEQGNSVIVAAPTGAGKTLIAEYVVDRALARGEQAIYTAPIKALSNQKYRDLCEAYPGDVGILTGDVAVDVDAPILIMTTEIFRNAIFDRPQGLAKVAHVVLDEIHYLDDIERGTVWEESIIFAPRPVRFVCLSATIPNLEELGAWVDSVRPEPVATVEETRRPVPLHHYFYVDGRVLSDLRHWRPVRGRRKRVPRPKGAKGKRVYPEEKLIAHIGRRAEVPCLYFAFSRGRCEELAARYRKLKLLDGQKTPHVLALYDALTARYGIGYSARAQTMRALVKRGVAYHHAGMLPSMKEVIERLFSAGFLKLIFTTETFALGINMPAHTVVLDELNRYDGVGFHDMLTRDYYQMAGRAGRRGKDELGLVYAKLDPRFITPKRVKSVVFGEPEPVRSQLNCSYATLLNLYRLLGEKVYEVYDRSFHSFRSSPREKAHAQQQIRQKLRLLEDRGYVQRGRLTKRGQFASRLYGHELQVAELVFQGLLQELNESTLSVWAVAAAYDPPERVRPSAADQKAAGLLAKRTQRVIHAIQRDERRLRIDEGTRSPHFGLAAATRAWFAGCDLDELRAHTSLDEGEVVRHFRRGVQLLRETAAALPGPRVLRQKLSRAVTSMNRDVVDAERQLHAARDASSRTEGGEAETARPKDQVGR